ncbi:hypothetical protein [Pseudoduganella chitinolytica]|uniref:DUF2987 domain-containing protein n=1 Tax=Pseudoduganella chitinolytica TaxID=34070 RepID=A0ABY8BI12_9BURK|nr:hypothetical protein [Pseudoduganella chitinolytica]WEF35485.1 hypothetical protein PX653_12265 [Pseudoduganella chitinolytica]
MKRLLPLLPLLLSLHPSAFAEEREWLPYKKLMEVSRLDKFYALAPAERDKLDMYVHLVPSNQDVKPRDLVLTVVHAGGRTPLPVDADGNLRLAPNPQWLAEDAKIMTNQPKSSKVGVGPAMNAVVPAGTQWSYGALMSSIPQSNAAIGKIAGALSMFAPTIRSVILKFDQPAQVTIQAKAGPKQYATDGKHQIRLKPDAALVKENPPMVLSARPREAELDSE